MTRQIRRLALLGAVVLVATVGLVGQTRASTADQVAKGRALFYQSGLQGCVQCHGANLQGEQGPTLLGKDFLARRGDFNDLRVKIKTTMPQSAPGSLTQEQAVELAHFILSQNGIAPDGFAEPAFRELWARADGPVAAGQTARSWLWGPKDTWTDSRWEPYAEAPGGQRLVQYFEKTRMEIIDLDADRNAAGYVTNGLLAKELVSGQIQTGNGSFQPHRPADTITVAGDADDANGPTYATFAGVATLTPGQNQAVRRDGEAVTRTIDRAGAIGNDPGLARYGVTIAAYDDNLGHNIPSVFWTYLNDIFTPWVQPTGLPLTEPFWARVKVGGEVKDVLIQVFERRVLTYTPSNNDGFKVEMGNVGSQYFRWRYGA